MLDACGTDNGLQWNWAGNPLLERLIVEPKMEWNHNETFHYVHSSILWGPLTYRYKRISAQHQEYQALCILLYQNIYIYMYSLLLFAVTAYHQHSTVACSSRARALWLFYYGTLCLSAARCSMYFSIDPFSLLWATFKRVQRTLPRKNSAYTWALCVALLYILLCTHTHINTLYIAEERTDADDEPVVQVKGIFLGRNFCVSFILLFCTIFEGGRIRYRVHWTWLMGLMWRILPRRGFNIMDLPHIMGKIGNYGRVAKRRERWGHGVKKNVCLPTTLMTPRVAVVKFNFGETID